MPVSNYSTPGVYVEEISTLPPSVVQASTAIPAFLGYTEIATANGTDLTYVPTRITSMLEYQQYFGKPAVATFNIIASGDSVAPILETSINAPIHKLYYSLDLFFKNGGSVCYIVSVGPHTVTIKTSKAFSDGLTKLETEEEPTLIVLSEAADLTSADEYHSLCKDALKQCAKIKNRFCILDVREGDTGGAAFRTGVGSDSLKFGAAYYPFLKTSLSYAVADTNIMVNNSTVPDTPAITTAKTAYDKAVGEAKTASDAKAALDIDTTATVAAKNAAEAAAKTKGNAADKAKGIYDKAVADARAAVAFKLDNIKATNTVLYNAVKLELNNPLYKITLPPSTAIAGVYATVDSERGVWKAPANVSLNAVINPVIKITADDQDKLNIDGTGGKSINAIRTFTGRGVMVWGARTLAGNDNEWRYVPVRRLFNMIEDSAAKATQFAVFEPNDSTTWLKVKSMIDLVVVVRARSRVRVNAPARLNWDCFNLSTLTQSRLSCCGC